MYALRDLVLRGKPKWSSPSIIQLKVNSKMTFLSFDETNAWAEVQYDGRNDPI